MQTMVPPRATAGQSAGHPPCPRGLESVARAAPCGEVAHGLGGIHLGGIDGVGGAQLEGQLAAIGVGIDGDDVLAPTSLHAWMAERPTPPAPNTTTEPPVRTIARFRTAPMPVITAQPTSAAISNGASRRMRTQLASGTTVRSAKVERNE